MTTLESLVDNEVLESLANTIIGTGFNFIYCLAIIFVCFGVSIYFDVRVRRIKRQIKKATDYLKGIPDEKGFAQEFENFNRMIIVEYPALAHAWNEYTENLVFPEPNDKELVVHNTKQAEEYFSSMSLVVTSLRVSFFNIFPGLLTGVGIWGTFLGLAAGIFLASDAMTAPDMEHVKHGLSNLLGGASLAFITSIFGLGCSMLFTVGKQRLMSSVDKVIDCWNMEVDKHVRLITVEKLAGYLQDELVAQTYQLKKFNDDIAISIANALDERVAGRIIPSIDKMISTLEGLRADRGDSTEALLEKIVTDFKQSLSGSTGSHFDSLASTLSTLNESIAKSAAMLNETQGRSEASADLIAKSVATALKDSTQTIKNQVADTVRVLSDTAQSTSSGMTRGIQDATKEAAKALTGMVSASSQSWSETVGKQFSAMNEMMLNFNASINRSTDVLKTTSDNAQNSAQAINHGVLKALESGTIVIQDQVKKAVQQLSDTAQRISGGMGEELKTASKQAASSMTEAMSVFQQRIAELDKSTERISSILAGSGDSMARIELITEQIAALHNTIKSTMESIDKTSSNCSVLVDGASKCLDMNRQSTENMRQVSTTFENTQISLKQSWESYRQRFEGIDESLQKVFLEIDEGLIRYTKIIQDFVSELDQKTGLGLDHLRGAISELQETIEELPDALSKVHR